MKKREKQDTSTIIKKSKRAKVWGWIFLIFGILYGNTLVKGTYNAAEHSSKEVIISLMIFFGCLGIYLIRKSHILKREEMQARQDISANVINNHNETEPTISSQKPESTKKVIPCRNCGANNTVTSGEICECEYCGSPLSLD